MLPGISIETILQNHGIGGGGGSGDGIKIIKSPTQPTTGLRNGIIWINTVTKEPRMYIDGSFVYFGNGLGILPYFGVVDVPTETNTVNIPIDDYFPASDILFVTQNTVQLTQTVHYDINKTTKQIVKKDGTWAKDTKLVFMVLAPSPAALAGITLAVYEKNVVVQQGVTAVNFDIPEYNPKTDYLRVHQRNLEIFKNLDWALGTDSQSIVLNTATVEEEAFHFTVQKKVRLAEDMGELVATKSDLQNHIFDPMPHVFSDGTNNYKLGIRIKPDTREIIFGWGGI